MRITQATSKNGTKALNKHLAEGIPNTTGQQNLWLEDEEGRAYQVQLTPDEIVNLVLSLPKTKLIDRLGSPQAARAFTNQLIKAVGGQS